MDLKRRDQTAARTGSPSVAAERLSTPDQLDQVIQVARFPSWLGLGSLILVVAAGIAASILFPVPITVRGEGILINVGGILTVTSDTEGRIIELLVAPGMTLEQGQVVAWVDQPQLRQRLLNCRGARDEARRRRERIEAFHRRTSTTQQQAIADQRRALEQRFEFASRQLRLLEEQFDSEVELNREGIISRRQLIETRTRINEAKEVLLAIENEIKQFTKVLTDQELAHQRELLEVGLEISDLDRQLASLEEEYERNREIRSPYAGRVVELKVNAGEIIARHGPVLSLLPTTPDTAAVRAVAEAPRGATSELIAVLYVPPAEGKKIWPGMEVQLELSSIKREEYGFMLGTVAAVAEVPSTTEGMMRILHNAQLVAQLSRSYAPFEVLVTLVPNPSTATGYQWSSAAGPEVEINVGTLCTGDVITRHDRPIRILLPVLGRWFDG